MQVQLQFDSAFFTVECSSVRFADYALELTGKMVNFPTELIALTRNRFFYDAERWEADIHGVIRAEWAVEEDPDGGNAIYTSQTPTRYVVVESNFGEERAEAEASPAVEPEAEPKATAKEAAKAKSEEAKAATPPVTNI